MERRQIQTNERASITGRWGRLRGGGKGLEEEVTGSWLHETSSEGHQTMAYPLPSAFQFSG